MNSLKSVTVIMPVRNEAVFIRRSLGAVLAQNYPSECMEVIVADGISDDETREIVGELISENGHVPVRLIDNPGRIVPTGLNAALRFAQGDIIIRVDGHCEIAPDYVRQCVEQLRQNGVDGVGGPIETIGHDLLSDAISVAMSSRFGVGGSAFRTINNKSMLVDTVAFPAYTRRIISQCGPFDEELVRNQDDEYNYRIRKLGGKILLSPDIKSRYYSRSSIRSLWRQYFQYGFWKVRVLQKHPRQMSLRQFVPPIFVTVLLGSALLASFAAWARLLLILVTAGYVLAGLSASVLTSWKKGWRYFPLLPFVFAALHLSYGSGFLVGLVRFAHRWKELLKGARGRGSGDQRSGGYS
jgi:glycosyltransferase involved in cell wall biosynthesis